MIFASYRKFGSKWIRGSVYERLQNLQPRDQSRTDNENNEKYTRQIHDKEETLHFRLRNVILEINFRVNNFRVKSWVEQNIGYQLDIQWDLSHPTFNLSLIVLWLEWMAASLKDPGSIPGG